jgi:TP901 family phage tail tape measure protein
MNQFGAGFVLSATDNATKVFRSVGNAYTKFSADANKQAFNLQEGMRKSALGLGAMKMGKEMIGIVTDTAAEAMPYEKLLTRTAALSGATEQQMANAHKAIMATHKDPELAAGALYEYARRGNDVTESLDGLMPAMHLATIMNWDAAQSAGFLSELMGEFNLKIKDTPAMTDKIAFAIKNMGIESEKLPVMLQAVAAGASVTGASFDDVLVAVSTVGKVFPNASRAAMAVNQSLVQLSGEKVRKGLKAMKIDVEDANGKFRPLLSIIGDVAKKTETMTEVQRRQALMSLFGGRATGGMSVIFDALDKGVKNATGDIVYGTAAVEALSNGFANSQGTAEALAKSYKNNLAGAWDRLAVAWKRMSLSFAPSALRIVRVVVDGIASAINTIADAIDSLPPEVKETIIGIVGGLGALVGMVGGLLAVQGVMSMLGISLSGMVFGVAKMILVVGPLMLLLTGLGVGFYALYHSVTKNSAGMGFSLDELQRKAKLAFSGMVEIISKGGLSDAMKEEMSKTENSGVGKFLKGFEAFVERLGALWDGVKRGFEVGIDALAYSPALARLRDTFGGFIDFITGGDQDQGKQSLEEWGAKGEALGEKLAGLGEIAADVTVSIIDFAKSFVAFVKDFNPGAIAAQIGGVVDAFRGFWNVLNVVQTALSAIYYTVKMVVSAVLELAWNLANLRGDIENWIAGGKRPQIATAAGWDWTTSGAEGLGKTFSDEADRLARKEEADRARPGNEALAREVAGLQGRGGEITRWMGTPSEQWTESPLSFAAAPQKMKDEWILKLDEINKRLKELGQQPIVVKIGEDVVGKAARKSPAFTGEDSLDPADAMGY